MSKFELQPAVPTVKEIFDKFEDAFFKALPFKSQWVIQDLTEAFDTAKVEVAKEVMPMT